MTLLKKLCVFGAKQETTPGTKQTLAVADTAFNVYDLEIEPDIAMDDRPAQGSCGTQRSIPGGRKGKCTFKIDLAFSGLAVPTWADILLPSVGLVKTGNVFAPKSQTPDTPSAQHKTITLGKWLGGKFRCLYGAMGTVKLGAPTNKTPVLEFEYMGIFDDEVAASMPTPTYPTDTKLVSRGGPASFDSVPLAVESMNFDLANEISLIEDSTKPGGYAYALVQDRKPKITTNPQSELVSVQNRMGLYLAGTEKVFRYVWPAPGYNSGTGAKSLELLASQAQVVANKEGNREGYAIDDMTLQLNQLLSSPDSDFTLTFNL